MKAEAGPKKKNSNRNIFFGGNQGSATVEAAIVLPLVMLAVLSVLSIIRIIGTYEKVQHALNQVAEELSEYSYLYAVSGFKEKHDAMVDNTDEANEELQQQQEAVTAFYQSMQSLVGNIGEFGSSDANAMDTLLDTVTGIEDADSNYETLTRTVEEIIKDPMGELRLIGYALSDTVLDEAKTALFGMISKGMLKANLSNEMHISLQKLDEQMRIRNGIEELDFSASSFMNDKKTIDLVVEYTVKPMPDFLFLPEIRLRNRACVLAWTWGVDKRTEPQENSEESIWNIDESKASWPQHKKRGDIAAERFAKELKDILKGEVQVTPYFFQTIDVIRYSEKGKGGKLYSTTSLNPFLTSYDTQNEARRAIRTELDKLKAFERCSSGGLLIDVSMLEGEYQRILVMVVPENELPEAYRLAFAECEKYAQELGIELQQVQKYGEYDKGEKNETDE